MATSPSFLCFPADVGHGERPRIALFGVAHGSTYRDKDSRGYEAAADLIRTASLDDADLIENWDFDLGGPLFNGEKSSCIDAGNIETVMHDNEGNRQRIESKTRELLTSQIVPIMIGGDCSATSPFVAAFEKHGPVWIVQIDAHIDWRDEVDGERHGYSSSMRRASEMPHVAGLVQVGLRSVGSARQEDVDAALRYGSHFITAREVHSHGVEAALRHIPKQARVVITLDCDGLDPGIMPGVMARTPGGLTYMQVIDLIAGISKHARISGFDLVEFYPPRDIDGISALTAARLVVNAIGMIVRQR